MKLSKHEINILFLLFKANNPLQAFTIYKRFRLTYSDFSKSIFSLIRKKLIIGKDNKFRITTIGRKRVFKEKNNYLLTQSKSWRFVPKEFMQTKIGTNDFYIPNRSLLDSRQFDINNLY